jgi:hypothetical protein
MDDEAAATPTAGEVPSVGPLGAPERQELLQLLTTEHFTIQTARSATITESVGRTTAFLSILAGSVVALALLAQVAISGRGFRLIAAGLLTVVLLIGLATYHRLLHVAAQDHVYRIAVNRIRRAYLELRPEAAPYRTLSGHDDLAATVASPGLGRPVVGWWQVLLSSAAMVAMIDAVLGAAIAVLAAISLTTPTLLAVALGVLVFVILTAGLLLVDARTFTAVLRAYPPRFPSHPP